MSETPVHIVRFEPVGVEMEVAEGETVLDAAFRQGVAVMHGCKEGQCSSCKALLIDGDVDMLKYSTFALPDYERESNHVLLCRTVAFSDITVELLNYDEDLMRRSIAVKEFAGKVVATRALTHDIRELEVELEQPIRFWAGQFVDITLPEKGITRSYSMASVPSSPGRVSFIIKKYPNGAFSNELDNGLKPGDPVLVKGPYGGCFRREQRPGPMVLVGGGSGMSPLWSILNDHIESGEQRPIRFFYGARTAQDLFYLDRFAEFERTLPDFRFIPALSAVEPKEAWTGETGYIHEVLARTLKEDGFDGATIDAYTCGPAPMIDAVTPVLQMAGVPPDQMYFDKFTQAVR